MEHKDKHQQHRRRPLTNSLDGFVTPRHQYARRSSHQAAPIHPQPKQTPLSPLNTPLQSRPTSTVSTDPARQNHQIPQVKQEVNQPKFSSDNKVHQPNMKVRRLTAAFLSMILLTLVASGGWVGWKFLRNASKVFGGNLSSILHTTKLKGEDSGRVNILLAGDSVDDFNHPGGQLTDSIMVVSIDTKNHTAIMLSIPRDLWVYVPTMGHQKINAANEVTSFNEAGYPKGGMGQLEKIVQNNLGIPIHYYALLNYSAFRDSVNAVGGVSINIKSEDPRGLYDPNIAKADGGPLKLPNGWNNLNGQTALNLARARGDPCNCGKYQYGFPHSDFDRTQHQRQLLVALEQKGASAGVVTNPLKVGQLFDAIGNNVKTDLNLADVLRLNQITGNININTVQSVTYSDAAPNPLLKSYLAPNGQLALIPTSGIDDFSQLSHYYSQLTSSDPLVKENASIEVRNGTNIFGYAKKAQLALQKKNLNVGNVGQALKIYPTTTIIDNSSGKKPATLNQLKQIYGNNVTTQQIETSLNKPDFLVILGSTPTPNY